MNVVNAKWPLLLFVPFAWSETFKFALCPKNTNHPFYTNAWDGCKTRAAALAAETGDTIECTFVGEYSSRR